MWPTQRQALRWGMVLAKRQWELYAADDYHYDDGDDDNDVDDDDNDDDVKTRLCYRAQLIAQLWTGRA